MSKTKVKPARRRARKAADKATAQTVSVAGKDLVIVEAEEYERLLDIADAAEAKHIAENAGDAVLTWDEIKHDFIHNRIAEIREKLGITQKELASKLNVKQSTVSRWEKLDANLTLETIRKIAAALHCPVHQLIA